MTDSKTTQTAEVVQKATAVETAIANNDTVNAVATALAPKVPKVVRNACYVTGVIAGALGTAGAVIASVLDSNSALLVGALAAFLLAAQSLLAKLHLSD